MGKNSSISQHNAGVRGIQPRGYLSGKLSVKDCNHRYSRHLFATLCSRYRGWWRKEPMEKGVKVKRYERCSVVTFETGADVLRHLKGWFSNREKYGAMSGASLLVVHECSKHHGFVRLLPLKEAEAQAKSMKAKAASAGK
jgi:hypothetical protein